MPLYDFACSRCQTVTEQWHRMTKLPDHIDCPDCGARADRQISTPNFSTRGDDLDGGKATYCPALARRMPYGRNDPQAYFTSKRKAREAARRKADSQEGYTLHLD